jgi:hypothetical protein
MTVFITLHVLGNKESPSVEPATTGAEQQGNIIFKRGAMNLTYPARMKTQTL